MEKEGRGGGGGREAQGAKRREKWREKGER